MLARKTPPANVLVARSDCRAQLDGDWSDDVPDLFASNADYPPNRPSEESSTSPATPSSPAADYMTRMMESQMDAWSSLRSAGFVSGVRWSASETVADEDDYQYLNDGFKESPDLNRSSINTGSLPHSASHGLSISQAISKNIEPVTEFPAPSAGVAYSIYRESLKDVDSSAFSFSVPSSRPETALSNHTSDSFTTCNESNPSFKEFEFHAGRPSPLRDSFSFDIPDSNSPAGYWQPPAMEGPLRLQEDYSPHSRSTTLETAPQCHSRSTIYELAPQYQDDYPLERETSPGFHTRSTTLETAPQYQDDYPSERAWAPQPHSRSTSLETAIQYQDDYSFELVPAPQSHAPNAPLDPAPYFGDDDTPTRYSEDNRSEVSQYEDDGVSSISGIGPSLVDDYYLSELSRYSRPDVFSLRKGGSDADTIREVEPQSELEFLEVEANPRTSTESSQASIIGTADYSFRPWSVPELKPTISRNSVVGRFNGPQQRTASIDSVAPPPIAISRASRPNPKLSKFGSAVNFSLLKRATLRRQAHSIPQGGQAELELLTQSVPYETARKGQTPFTNYQVASVYPQKKPWALSAGSQKKIKKVPIGLGLIQEHEIAEAATKLGGLMALPLRGNMHEQRHYSPVVDSSRMPVLAEE